MSAVYDDPLGFGNEDVDFIPDLPPAPPLSEYEDNDEARASTSSHSVNPDGRASRTYDPAEEEAFRQREEARRVEREELFSRLNPRQQEAVNFPSASVLILAGAGSGKTSVLTARIAHLVSYGLVGAKEVLAVTFTNKAAQEMQNRLRKLLDGRSVHDMWVGTFHSLCVRILRENYKAAGLPKTFGILDVDGQEAVCRGILRDFGLTKASVKEAAKARKAAAALDLLSAADPLAAAGALAASDLEDDGAPSDFATPGQCAKYISSRKEAQHDPKPPASLTTSSNAVEQMEAVFAEYQVRTAKAGLLDFQDLLTQSVALLRKDEIVRNAYRRRFATILVDETQDTNDIQYEWLELIKGPKSHVMAVGDDSQSIYSFRGARPENMQRFLKEMTVTKTHRDGAIIKLEQNYRSLPHILEAANAIIERNPAQIKKTLFTSQRDKGERIDVVTFGNGMFEASAIARSIHKLVKQQDVAPAEIAILYRTNQQSRLLEQELNKLGVPLTVYGGYRFYDRQEIKHLMAYLDLVCDMTRDISFARVVNFPPRSIGERTVEELRQEAQRKRISMMEMVGERSIAHADNADALGNAAAQKKQRLLEGFTTIILDLADAAQTVPLSDLIEAVLDQAGIREHYLEEATGSKSSKEETEDRLANIGELVSAAKQFQIDNPTLLTAAEQLPEYLAHVALMTSTSESDMSRKNTVSLMTVHSSKGLEFDHVYMAGLEEATFPHSRAIEEDAELGNGMTVEEAMQDLGVSDGGEDLVDADFAELQDGPGIQEERRLMYVAVTRARKSLTITHAKERMLNGEPKLCAPSRFLLEIPAHRLNEIDDAKERYGGNKAYQRDPGNREYGGDAFDEGRTAYRSRPTPNTTTKSSSARAELCTQSSFTADQMSTDINAGIIRTDSADGPQPGPAPVLKPWHRRGAAALAAVPLRSPASTGGGERLNLQAGDHAKPAKAAGPDAGPRTLAIIGTAGRDKSEPMTAQLWAQMVNDAKTRVRPTDTLVSGGAAWADHLAVRLYLDGDVQHLVLHLPAPLVSGQFQGERESAASAGNYYHDLFLRNAGVPGLAEIAAAINKGATVTEQPVSRGYGAMFARNTLVARQADEVLAYTFGAGDTPADGGTKNTWDQVCGSKQHVALHSLGGKPSPAPPASQSLTPAGANPSRMGPSPSSLARLDLLGKNIRRSRP